MGRVGRGLPPRLICRWTGSAGGSQPPRRAHFLFGQKIFATAAVRSHTLIPRQLLASWWLVCRCASSRAPASVAGNLLGLRLQKPGSGCCRAFGFLWISHSMQFGLEPHSGRVLMYVLRVSGDSFFCIVPTEYEDAEGTFMLQNTTSRMYLYYFGFGSVKPCVFSQ